MQTPDEAAAFQAVHDAFKQGINFFDVAPFYAAGKAEEVSSGNLWNFLTEYCACWHLHVFSITNSKLHSAYNVIVSTQKKDIINIIDIIHLVMI